MLQAAYSFRINIIHGRSPFRRLFADFAFPFKAMGGSMGWDCFDISTTGGVAHLRLSRPDRRNAMTECILA
ncbi:MAG: hypothetical protein O3A06_03555 [Proteobacteria bacterium]|nr:hypothetical protein [Pseudomonadota bacterium]